MIYQDDELPCCQCDAMVNTSDLDDSGMCPDCAYENGLVSDIIDNQPKYIDKMPYWYLSTFSSS